MRSSFFKDIPASICSPEFYAERQRADAAPAWKYFMLFVLLVAFVATLIFSIKAVPVATRIFSKATVDKIVALYPEELTMTFKAGTLTTNVDEPYAIPIPGEYKSYFAQSKNGARVDAFDNIVAIDTASASTIEAYASHRALVVFTKDHVITLKNNRGQYEVTSLREFPDTTVTRATLERWGNDIEPLFAFVAPLLIIGGFLVFLVSTVVGSLFTILILSLVVWVVFKLRRAALSYRMAFTLGLYAVTLPLLVKLVASAFGFSPFWLVSAALFLAVMFLNVRAVPAAPQPSA